MNKHNSVPNIRFNGFEDEWKGKELNSISKRLDNFRKPITANKRITGKTPYYGANGVQDYVKGYTHEGEFVLIAEDGANDVRNYPVRFVKGYIWVNNHAHVLQAKVDISNNLFLSYSLKNKNLLPYLVGSGRMKLNADVLMNLLLKIPSLKEQQKIGNFFSRLDKLLDLQQQKIDKLELLKKTLLQMLFPKYNKKIPDVRFRGFYDKWEKITFSEIGTVTTGNTPSTKQTRYYSKMGTPWITPSNIDKNGKLYNLKYLSKEGAKIGRIVPAGSVLVTSIASIGKNTLLKKDSAFNQQINAITPKKKYDSYFLYSACNQVSKEMKNTASAGTMQIVNKKAFSRMVIKCPLLSEQQKIGNLLSKVDQLIELENKKLQNFQQLKKCLLQNMFVE